jgi:hypothetical protein
MLIVVLYHNDIEQKLACLESLRRLEHKSADVLKLDSNQAPEVFFG